MCPRTPDIETPAPPPPPPPKMEQTAPERQRRNQEQRRGGTGAYRMRGTGRSRRTGAESAVGVSGGTSTRRLSIGGQ